MDNSHKILVITGPTATGKSDLAVKLAKIFDGEVISADSRQVYKGLDIGTGKITTEEMQSIPHHLLDIVDANKRFTVVDWKSAAIKAIEEVSARGKLPIVCGGTGYYISALVDNKIFPEVPSDPEEHKKLELKTAQELIAELKRLDPKRAESMQQNGESANKRRLARAIIVASRSPTSAQTGRSPTLSYKNSISGRSPTSLQIGITLPDAELRTRIHNRLIKRLDAGMIEEAKRLNEAGLSFERMNELGLEYRYLAQFLQRKLTREELTETLSTKIWQYARRQKTWFRRNKKIVWFAPDDLENITARVKQFLA